MSEAAGVTVREATVGALVREMRDELARAGIPDAKREAGDIIAAVLDVPRFWALLHESEAPDAAVADVFGTFAVVVGVILTQSRSTPNSSATTCATLMNSPCPISVPPWFR